MPAGPRKSSRGLAALGRSRRPEAGRGQIGFVRAIWGRGEQWAAGAGGSRQTAVAVEAAGAARAAGQLDSGAQVGDWERATDTGSGQVAGSGDDWPE